MFDVNSHPFIDYPSIVPKLRDLDGNYDKVDNEYYQHCTDHEEYDYVERTKCDYREEYITLDCGHAEGTNNKLICFTAGTKGEPKDCNMDDEVYCYEDGDEVKCKFKIAPDYCDHHRRLGGGCDDRRQLNGYSGSKVYFNIQALCC